MTNDSLGDRMKRYEEVSKTRLVRRMPVVMRLDGKAFHTFTRGFVKPYDGMLMDAMRYAMKALCEEVQGCVIGYTQSDEITLILVDYKSTKSDPWFNDEVQKMVGISASTATLEFNRRFHELVCEEYLAILDDIIDECPPECEQILRAHLKADKLGAKFDSRVFNVPENDVANCLIWRQQDATRNSIEAAGHAYFSAKRLDKVSCSGIQELLWNEKGIDWNDYPTDFKRGSCCIKTPQIVNTPDGSVMRMKWTVDHDIPIFTQNREYIERLTCSQYFKEENQNGNEVDRS